MNGVDIQAIIEPIIRGRLQDASIDSIEIEHELDEDGDPVLLIRVVFDSKISRIDPNKSVGLARELWPALSKAGEESFPIISFISQSDNKDLLREAV